MGRPRNGEKPTGVTKPCRYCGVDIYRRASLASGCSTFFHMKCLKSSAYNFSCCICGKKTFTQPAQIKYRNRNTCSISCRSKKTRLVALQRRERDGYTKHQLDRLARYSPEAEKWRVSIFKRDNFTCQICGERGGKLEADHIKPWAYFEELRFDLSNGRTLCRECHDTTKISAKEMRKLYGKN